MPGENLTLEDWRRVMVMNQAPRYDMNFQRDYSNLMDFLLNRRSPLLPRVNETQSQVQVLVQEPDLGRR